MQYKKVKRTKINGLYFIRYSHISTHYCNIHIDCMNMRLIILFSHKMRERQKREEKLWKTKLKNFFFPFFRIEPLVSRFSAVAHTHTHLYTYLFVSAK